MCSAGRVLRTPSTQKVTAADLARVEGGGRIRAPLAAGHRSIDSINQSRVDQSRADDSQSRSASGGSTRAGSKHHVALEFVVLTLCASSLCRDGANPPPPRIWAVGGCAIRANAARRSRMQRCCVQRSGLRGQQRTEHTPDNTALGGTL